MSEARLIKISDAWNGHWTYSDLAWKVAVGIRELSEEDLTTRGASILAAVPGSQNASSTGPWT